MDDKMNDVIDEVQKRLGEEYEVKRVEVMKNNDTKETKTANDTQGTGREKWF